jgi:cyclopropane fatty-acyl-phospholipid synthase-like methyltransferase
MRWLTYLFVAAVAFGQDPRYASKLAPYVASPVHVVDHMLELAKVKPGETLYDLGCGDGIILVEAVLKFHVNAIGVEISPKLVAMADERIHKAGVQDQAHVTQGDLLKVDLTGADVVAIYLSTQLNSQLRPRLEKYLKPGSRVVSHDYPVQGWKPTKVETDGKQGHLIYLYEMPATKN